MLPLSTMGVTFSVRVCESLLVAPFWLVVVVVVAVSTGEPLAGGKALPLTLERGTHRKSFFTAFCSISLSMIIAMIASRIVSR